MLTISSSEGLFSPFFNKVNVSQCCAGEHASSFEIKIDSSKFSPEIHHSERL